MRFSRALDSAKCERSAGLAFPGSGVCDICLPLRIDGDGNSLPAAGKSTGMAENAATELKYPLLG